MRKIGKGICLGLCIIILFTAGMYLGLSWYYVDEFSYNTWINGIYCTGKSVEEVNQELQQAYVYAGLAIRDDEGNSYLIAADTIGCRFDFRESLEIYKSKENPYLWVDHLFQANQEKKILPVIHYEEAALRKEVKGLPIMEEVTAGDGKTARADGGLIRSDRTVKIEKTPTGYQLINEREHVLDPEKAYEVIVKALEQLETETDLRQAGCYEDLPLTDHMKQELALWPRIRAFQDCKIVYQMGEDLVPVDASVVCDWFALQENGEFVLDAQGNPVLDGDGIKRFIVSLCAEYDTLGGSRQFRATRGEILTVTGGTYGNRMNQEAEIAYLTEAFLEGREEIHTPEYVQKALYQGKDDIGDTYIEIDMTGQMMYYYVQGECVIETPVVTGNTSRRRGTPEGVNYVYAKQQNRVLRGEGYASPVKFWMPVKGAVGIHDASWRSEYGGEIYKTNGSHGCINTPYDAVKQMYERMEVGTPCVMFY